MLAVFSLPTNLRHKKRKVLQSRKRWESANLSPRELMEILFKYTEHMVHDVIPEVRAYSEGAVKTAGLSQLAKLETPPESFMSVLMSQYMNQVEDENRIPYPDEVVSGEQA